MTSNYLSVSSLRCLRGLSLAALLALGINPAVNAQDLKSTTPDASSAQAPGTARSSGLTEGRKPLTLSVTAYGAIANDDVDDTAAINANIAALGASGGTVTFPAGTFKLTINPADRNRAAIVIPEATPLTLQGAGKNATTLKLAEAQGNFGALIGPSPSWLPVRQFTLRDLTINQNGSANPITAESDIISGSLRRIAVRIFPGSDTTIRDCRFTDFIGSNVITINAAADNTDALIENCDFDAMGGGAIDFDHSTIYTNGDRMTVRGCTFTSRGVGQNGCRTAIEIHGCNQTVTGNTINGFTFGINVTGYADGLGSQHQLYADNILTNVGTGFVIWAGTDTPSLDDIVIRDNQITIDVNGWGDWFDAVGGIVTYGDNKGPITNLLILRNTITFTNTSGAARYYDEWASGIAWTKSHSTASITKGLRIIGNTITDSPGPGIYFGDTLYTAEISGNTITNPGRRPRLTESSSAIELVDQTRGATRLPTTFSQVQINDNIWRDTRNPKTLLYGIYDASDPRSGCSHARNTSEMTHGGAITPFRANPTPRSGGTRWVVEPTHTIQFSSAASTASSTAASATLTAALSSASLATVTVDYSILSGSATTPADYTLAAGTLRFAPGETTKPITVTLVNNPANFTQRTLEVRLAFPLPSTVGLGLTASHQLTLVSSPKR